MAKGKTQKLPLLRPGDTVLLGTYAAMPGEWWTGRVLAVHGENLWLLRSTLNGDEYTQESSIHHVRAVGPYVDLMAVKASAHEAVKQLVEAVDEASSVLGRARDAVHSALKDLTDRGLKIFPYDHAAEQAHIEQVRATVEKSDMELMSGCDEEQAS